jgi:hypothetical protein
MVLHACIMAYTALHTDIQIIMHITTVTVVLRAMHKYMQTKIMSRKLSQPRPLRYRSRKPQRRLGDRGSPSRTVVTVARLQP